jgi:hypothetical protein
MHVACCVGAHCARALVHSVRAGAAVETCASEFVHHGVIESVMSQVIAALQAWLTSATRVSRSVDSENVRVRYESSRKRASDLALEMAEMQARHSEEVACLSNKRAKADREVAENLARYAVNDLTNDNGASAAAAPTALSVVPARAASAALARPPARVPASASRAASNAVRTRRTTVRGAAHGVALPLSRICDGHVPRVPALHCRPRRPPFC